MKFLVTSDLHLPTYYKEFYESLNKINEKIDFVILCGDIIDNKEHIYIKKLYYLLNSKFGNIKIFSTFGNNESSFLLDREKDKDFYRKEYNFINWLDYEYYDLGEYYLLGFEGFPERTWKMVNIENIKEYYYKKLENIFNSLNKKVIVFSHYGLSKDTILGDPAPEWSLYSKYIENLIRKYSNKIIYGFHGHAHHSKNYKTRINNTEIYNVAFPLHKKPLIFEI
ncbi:MAG: metallophosphoesterase [Candidatus Nanopusillus acidilobi]